MTPEELAREKIDALLVAAKVGCI